MNVSFDCDEDYGTKRKIKITAAAEKRIEV